MKTVTRIVYNHIPELTEQMKARVSLAVRKTALDIERISKESMQGPKSGVGYARAGGKVHQASAPGEAPAIDYGVLVNSIQVEMESQTRAVVYTNTEYAAVLEFGGARMAARPFFTPAAEQVWPGFEMACRQILK